MLLPLQGADFVAGDLESQAGGQAQDRQLVEQRQVPRLPHFEGLVQRPRIEFPGQRLLAGALFVLQFGSDVFQRVACRVVAPLGGGEARRPINQLMNGPSDNPCSCRLPLLPMVTTQY